MTFFENYFNWDKLGVLAKKQSMQGCVSFYEAKTLDYILSNLPLATSKNFKKEPVKVEFVNDDGKQVAFGDNVVFIQETAVVASKKNLFFDIAKNTICAVFAHIFKNTSSNSNKKTKFSTIASGFLASITSEFAKGEDFANDMMEQFEMTISQDLSLEN